MANYIVWYGKKRAQLGRQEKKFTALLRKTTDAQRLEAGAEKIRAAHVRALKSVQAQLSPTERNTVAVANLGLEIEFWLSLTAEEIIQGYRSGTLRGRPATAVVREWEYLRGKIRH